MFPLKIFPQKNKQKISSKLKSVWNSSKKKTQNSNSKIIYISNTGPFARVFVIISICGLYFFIDKRLSMREESWTLAC